MTPLQFALGFYIMATVGLFVAALTQEKPKPPPPEVMYVKEQCPNESINLMDDIDPWIYSIKGSDRYIKLRNRGYKGLYLDIIVKGQENLKIPGEK